MDPHAYAEFIVIAELKKSRTFELFGAAISLNDLSQSACQSNLSANILAAHEEAAGADHRTWTRHRELAESTIGPHTI